MDLFKVKSCPFEGEKRRVVSGGLEESWNGARKPGGFVSRVGITRGTWYIHAYNGPTALSRASPLHKVGVNLSLPFYSAHASFQGWPDKRRTREMGPRFPRFFPSLFWLTRSTSKRARCYRPITRNSFEGRVEYPAVRFIEFLLAFRSPISPRYIYIYTVVVSLKENSVAIPRSMKERERKSGSSRRVHWFLEKLPTTPASFLPSFLLL